MKKLLLTFIFLLFYNLCVSQEEKISTQEELQYKMLHWSTKGIFEEPSQYVYKKIKS